MYLIRIHIVISWVYLCRRNKNVERSSMKKLFLLRFSVAAFFCLLCVLPALAANIKIKGAVKDKLSKEPLIGATIRLVGTPAGAVTDMDGNFELNSTGVLEGLYDIEIKYVGYKTEVRRKVRVENGKLAILNLELETDAHELSDVVVVAKKNRENENMLLLEQQKAVIAVQASSVDWATAIMRLPLTDLPFLRKIRNIRISLSTSSERILSSLLASIRHLMQEVSVMSAVRQSTLFPKN